MQHLFCSWDLLRRIKPKLFFLFLGIFLFGAGHFSVVYGQKPEKVSIQLKWRHQFQFAGYYAALHKGFYAEEGLDVTILEGGPDRPSIQTVLDQKADFGVSDSDVMLHRLQGARLVVCATIFQHSPYVILSRRDRNIRYLSDLVGAKMMLADDQGETQFNAMLIREGIDPSELQVLEHSWDINDLIEGRTDAISAYAMVEPITMRKMGIEPSFLRAIDYGIDFYGDVLFTTEDYIQKHPDRADRFIRASLRGWTYAFDYPEEIVDIILELPGVKESGLTKEILLQQAKEMRSYVLPDIIDIGHMNPGRWQQIASIYAELKLAPRGVDIHKFIYSPTANSSLDKVILWRITGIGAIILAVAWLVVLWNIQIHRQVWRRTSELRSEINHRITAENELRKSQAHLQRILESTGEGIHGIDKNGNIIFENPAACKILGYAPNELIKKPLHETIHHSHPDGTFYLKENSPITQTLNDGEVRFITNEYFFKKNGESFPVEYICSPLHNSASEINGAVICFRDVTIRKKLELQTLRSQRMESIGTLAGGIAHDLNNVLTPILMSLELLQQNQSESSQDSSLIKTLKTCAQRGSDLVRQVLTFARGTEGRRIPVNLSDICHDLQLIISETFPKRLRFQSDIPDNLWPLLGDPTQIHQAIMNLCVNARDAMPNGGTLTISLQNKDFTTLPPDIDPSTPPGSYVVIEISDTGSGIPLPVQERIFDPFFTTKETGTGTGLGLSTTLAIIKSHGGFIQVHSRPDQGATFRLYFPAHLEALEPTPDPVSPTSSDSGKNHLILLIDDERSIRDVATRILKSKGYQTFLAQDGEEALALYSQNRDKISLVITDMAMPNMDGTTTIQALRKINPDVIIIASSGFPDGDMSEQSPAFRPNAFLHKPYTARTLFDTIETALTKNKS